MDLTIQLNDACNKLRILIRNEEQAKDYSKAWVEMSLTSTQKKKQLKEQETNYGKAKR